MTLILQTQPKIINVEHEEIPSYGPKEIQEIKDAILDTVTFMGGDREDIAVKYLKRIASEANCHWKAIQSFLLDEKVSFAIMNNIATAFSAVKVVENDNAEQISNSVDLVSKIFDYDFNAVTVNWFYPKGSKVSLYKKTIRKFVETITKAHTDYWEKDCNLKGDQLDMLDYRSDLEDDETISNLFEEHVDDTDDEELNIDVKIFHQQLPIYMHRFFEGKSDTKKNISSFLLVFNWQQHIDLNSIRDSLEGKDVKHQESNTPVNITYKPRFNSLIVRENA